MPHRFEAKDSTGTSYSKIPRIQFPADKTGRTILVHNMTHYSKRALYDQVENWIHNGIPATGQFDPTGSIIMPCRANPLNLTQGPAKMRIKGFEDIAATQIFDKSTFGIQWKPKALEPWQGSAMRGLLPQFCKQVGKQMVAMDSSTVPEDTGLMAVKFMESASDHAYTSPTTGDNCWTQPGPKAGPFMAKLSDGSLVTYYWYRFIDQPSMQDADLSTVEKARLQALVEKIHAQWTTTKEYMAAPKIGTLASLDPALLVKPPRGLEVGYVPIAVRQSAN